MFTAPIKSLKICSFLVTAWVHGVSEWVHTCILVRRVSLSCASLWNVFVWSDDTTRPAFLNEVGFFFFIPGEYWSCQVNCTRGLRSGWRWRQSGARWVALTWSSVDTAGPSAEDFFQGRPSLGTWHSSARPDPTSCRSDYHSSAGTSGDIEPTGGWQAHALIWAGSEMVIFSQFN